MVVLVLKQCGRRLALAAYRAAHYHANVIALAAVCTASFPTSSGVAPNRVIAYGTDKGSVSNSSSDSSLPFSHYFVFESGSIAYAIGCEVI